MHLIFITFLELFYNVLTLFNIIFHSYLAADFSFLWTIKWLVKSNDLISWQPIKLHIRWSKGKLHNSKSKRIERLSKYSCFVFQITPVLQIRVSDNKKSQFRGCGLSSVVVTGMLERRIVSHSSRISISLGRMSSFTGWHGSDYPVQCLRMGITYRVRVVIPRGRLGQDWWERSQRAEFKTGWLWGCDMYLQRCWPGWGS